MSLERIAQLAGVSRATVSRVINNHPYVKEHIRQRVLKIIEEEGFQPNAAARMLARQRTDVLAVVAPEGIESIFTGMYFPMLLGGISSIIAQSDYVMSLWVGSTPEETDRIYKRILGYKLMDGALILSAIDTDSLPPQLVERKMPLVMIGRSALPEIATIDVDNYAASRSAVETLLRLGRRRIGHISGRRDISSAKERLQGYRAALEANRIPFDPALVFPGDFTEQGGYAAARAFSNQVDAIFAANDLSAIGAMYYFHENGINVPQDVAIIGFDDLPVASTVRPALTTVRQPIRDMGIIATQTLLGIIEGRIALPYRVLLPAELMIRESCGTLRNQYSQLSG